MWCVECGVVNVVCVCALVNVMCGVSLSPGGDSQHYVWLLSRGLD